MSQGRKLRYQDDYEAVRLLTEGLIGKQIADRLGCTHCVLRWRLGRLKRLLGAKTLAHAAVLYDRMQREKT